MFCYSTLAVRPDGHLKLWANPIGDRRRLIANNGVDTIYGSQRPGSRTQQARLDEYAAPALEVSPAIDVSMSPGRMQSLRRGKFGGRYSPRICPSRRLSKTTISAELADRPA